jgi:hypothetical protein
MTSYLLCNVIFLTYVRYTWLKYIQYCHKHCLFDILIRVWIVLIVCEWFHFFKSVKNLVSYF